ncbi:DUF4389 domain-containing protein [Candidatus Micrarchaeota archaeon]|nr:DUF4389 domain-containing protein [Candidatus Micrarchaeota archaeon]
MQTVTVDVQGGESASRVELFVRFLYAIVGGIVLWVLSIVSGVCWILQFLIVLITAKRNQTLDNVLRMYFKYSTRLSAYLLILTEERPPLIPEE